MAANCIGNQVGTVVVSENTCIEPKFGLAFKTNGTYLSISNNCMDTDFVNTVRCNADEGCCYFPESLSINITTTDLSTTGNETRHTPNTSGSPTGLPSGSLPAALPGRKFVCIEQNI